MTVGCHTSKETTEREKQVVREREWSPRGKELPSGEGVVNGYGKNVSGDSKKKKKQIVLENTKVKTVNYFLSRQEEPREEWSWKE